MSRNLKERWDLDDIGNMLNPAPLRLEMGITRTDDGRLVVACRSDLMGCKGAMLNWWFSYFCTTQHLKWWYPRDHKHHYGWDDKWKKGENYIGATVHAVESLNDIPPVAAKIKFHHPSDFFSSESVTSAFEKKWLSAAVCGCIGFGDDEIDLDDSGDPVDGRMIHIVRDTAWGCVLRSRFILGESASNHGSPVTDEVGLGLLHHCHCEFASLSRILPSIYYAENTDNVGSPDWW